MELFHHTIESYNKTWTIENIEIINNTYTLFKFPNGF